MPGCLGANFGFDIPNETLTSTDMQKLIDTETRLAQYKPGDPQCLAGILKQFMELKHLLKI